LKQTVDRPPTSKEQLLFILPASMATFKLFGCSWSRRPIYGAETKKWRLLCTLPVRKALLRLDGVI